MKLHILYFGVLKDLLGRDSEVLELPTGFSVAEFIETLRERESQSGNAWDQVWESLAVAVNQEYARPDEELFDGDEVALLPPVSGGDVSDQLLS